MRPIAPDLGPFSAAAIERATLGPFTAGLADPVEANRPLLEGMGLDKAQLEELVENNRDAIETLASPGEREALDSYMRGRDHDPRVLNALVMEMVSGMKARRARREMEQQPRSRKNLLQMAKARGGLQLNGTPWTQQSSKTVTNQDKRKFDPWWLR